MVDKQFFWWMFCNSEGALEDGGGYAYRYPISIRPDQAAVRRPFPPPVEQCEWSHTARQTWLDVRDQSYTLEGDGDRKEHPYHLGHVASRHSYSSNSTETSQSTMAQLFPVVDASSSIQWSKLVAQRLLSSRQRRAVDQPRSTLEVNTFMFAGLRVNTHQTAKINTMSKIPPHQFTMMRILGVSKEETSVL
ncbi:hypothetical protein MKZ38_005841 [Zalerion maritima]|uniref:Uncharacterized protein n=1 Tax=Zalerion maritima TaxID=339359 RepID=A0AAD5WNS5_9PEZI|nr:hypothetical protein MKZ38_005841 [Zalerion maritima]